LNALNVVQNGSVADLRPLLTAAFVFGLLHARLFGHAKAVLSS
jgi:ABC-type nickel/cobalt efflux system permease component RcnA